MKHLVLLSGGLDSTTTLASVAQKANTQDIIGLSFEYGQLHNKELECAKQIAQHYGIKHIVINTSNIFKYSDCTLLKHSSKPLALGSYTEQLKEQKVLDTAVPFRNGLFLSIAATIAQSIAPNELVNIYLSNHSNDSANNAYPDCSIEFVTYMTQAIAQGTSNKVNVVSLFAGMTKADVVAQGLRFKAPYRLTWSCYKGSDSACGKCGTCIDRLEAFKANNTTDVVKYEEV